VRPFLGRFALSPYHFYTVRQLLTVQKSDKGDFFMLNIKKQIHLLYLSSVLGNLSVTGAWVAILAFRGFSLVQIGVAETVFHITSLIFEIPSGILADRYGRKKMLIVSHVMAVIGNLIMVFSEGLGMVCLSFVFHALNYNFASGSGDALAYDSLKSVKQEGRYETYFSNQMIIYRVGSALSTLCAGLAFWMGYKMAYFVSAITHVVTLLVVLGLVEVQVAGAVDAQEAAEQKGIAPAVQDKVTQELTGDKHIIFGMIIGMMNHFKDSILFLAGNGKATRLMFANSLVGAIDILLLFFLQAKLTSAGIMSRDLGIALFVMEMGGIVGARMIVRIKRGRYLKIFMLCTAGVLTGVLLEHSGVIPVMVFGGFLSAMADDALQVRTDALLQESFPSQQRATLISISSFTFSVLMIVLSPLAGYFYSVW